ncbi:MAG: hypothetical protein IKJ69_05580 [Clostridia bacterium]|nr:hypothetical protein [Clostridia bacterium]
MDEKKNLDRIDELHESTSSENRIKFNLADIEATDVALEERFGTAPEIVEEEMPSPTIEVAPVEEEIFEEVVEPEEPVAAAAPVMKIIDETTTVISDDEPVKAEEKKPKKAKKKMKFNALQIIIIAVVAIATLWTVIYTVDHTLAAQGYSPAFSVSSTAYDDGSVSYKCLGYKVQFMYDSNDNLTQKCVPFWEDGPNDIRFNQGLLFEVAESDSE